MIKQKIFAKANSQRKKYGFLFQKLVFLFNTGNEKNDCNNIVEKVLGSNFVFKLVNLSSYKGSCK